MKPPRPPLLPSLLLALALGLGALDAAAGDLKEKEPSPKATGEAYLWKAKDDLVFAYRIPKGYDEAKGANLTVILHGSNLTHGWGFANHDVKTFRPDDIVVSPDGTTPNGQGGFNFLGEAKDAKRFKAFLDELRERLRIQRVYLYGHSQGSFFALYFAGEYPDEVDGVVAHASGVWTWTQQGKKGHHQAIVLMHGTQDPVVPYGQSVGGYASYVDAKYPMVRLCSLEGWNHWPAEHNGPVPHTSQELAWCEGMTSDDAARLEACLDFLSEAKSKERHDYAALRDVAARIADLEAAPDALRQRAAKAVEAVDVLSLAHVSALEIPAKAEFEGGAWPVHLAVLLRSFRGVPACETLREAWKKVLERHEKDAIKHLRKYWAALRKEDRKEAFQEGAAALEKGFLHYECWDRTFLDNLAAWRKDARALGLRKGDTKDYDAFIKEFDKALKDGYRDFDKVNAKAKL